MVLPLNTAFVFGRAKSGLLALLSIPFLKFMNKSTFKNISFGYFFQNGYGSKLLSGILFTSFFLGSRRLFQGQEVWFSRNLLLKKRTTNNIFEKSKSTII